MREEEAGRVVEALQRRGILARVARPASFRFGVRIPLGDGREVLWDVDGAAGLEAQIMRDGVLVGFVAHIPGSEDFSEAQTVAAIAAADYNQGAAPQDPQRPGARQDGSRDALWVEPPSGKDRSGKRAKGGHP